MASARPAASLNPALLARKGGARPAMRSAQADDNGQQPGNRAIALDANPLDEANTDLGWNDMGEDLLVTEPPAHHLAAAAKGSANTALREPRSAFTLRLDPQRHFRLRLACTLRNCSAQTLVTEALDLLLEKIPQLEAVSSQAKPPIQTVREA